MRTAICCPDEKHYGKGMCKRCYQKNYQSAGLRPEKPASCHPEKALYSRGLCATCYEQAYRSDKPRPDGYMVEYHGKLKEEHPHKVEEAYQRRRSDPVKRKRDARTSLASHYKNKYGMTIDEVHSLFHSQDRKCALCKDTLDEKTMMVDHCHETGRVRGILCRRCNSGLGFLGDTAQALGRALEYLKRSADTGQVNDLLAKSSPPQK